MKHTTRTLVMTLACLTLISTASAQDWPQWRGPNRDNHVTGFTEPKTWPKELTKKWSISVGVGEASPVLVGDKLYTFGRQGGDEVLLCLDAMTGKELWKNKYAAEVVTGGANKYPGPRSTPAVGDGMVCTLGVGGILTCTTAVTGKRIWQHNKGKPKFYTATSPLIVDGKCIVFAGAFTAFDLKSGDAKWSISGAPSSSSPTLFTPNVEQQPIAPPQAGYGSPVLMTADGVKQIVIPCTGLLAGANFADGKMLWKVNIGDAWQNNYSTPLVDGNTVYYSITPAGKGKGGKGGDGAATGFIALKIEKKGNIFTASEIWRKSPAAGYHTPVLRDGLIYGVSAQGKNFFCLDAKTGDKKWNDDADHGDCGCILSVGSVLIALTSEKDLIVFRPGSKEYSEVARYRVSSSPTWCVPILAGNRIYVKDKGGSLTLWTVE
jgi:outer membrane protein assembly factor BamB